MRKQPKVHRVCVYCGSSLGEQPVFKEFARSLGKQLAEQQIDLIYGGGNVGLMKIVADATLSYGGQVHGVIPELLYRRERAHTNLTALHVTDSMHERKAMMAEMADAFIALPGGFGTFEELLESITWVQLKLHNKPVIVCNVNGYYDNLLEMIGHAVQEGFIHNGNQRILQTAGSVDECLRLLGNQ